MYTHIYDFVPSIPLEGASLPTLMVLEPTLSVASISYATHGGADGNEHLNVSVSDGDGGPVRDASVQVRIDNVSIRQAWMLEGVTAEDGRATLSLMSAPPGAYRTTVTSLRAEALTWDGVLLPSAFRK